MPKKNNSNNGTWDLQEERLLLRLVTAGRESGPGLKNGSTWLGIARRKNERHRLEPSTKTYFVDSVYRRYKDYIQSIIKYADLYEKSLKKGEELLGEQSNYADNDLLAFTGDKRATANLRVWNADEIHLL